MNDQVIYQACWLLHLKYKLILHETIFYDLKYLHYIVHSAGV